MCGAQRRRHSKHKRRQERDDRREAERSITTVQIDYDTGGLCGQEHKQAALAPFCQQKAEGRAEYGKDRALRQQEAQQPPSARTDGSFVQANGPLASA